MTTASLESAIDAAWERRNEISPATRGETRDAIEAALDELDSGALRVAEKRDGKWHTNQWLKKAVLLSFRLYDSMPISGGGDFAALGRGPAAWYDKVASKFAGWGEAEFKAAGFRAQHFVAQGAQLVVAPTVVALLRAGRHGRFGDEALVHQPLQQRVQGAGA